ncbi:MAG: hypothetical protein AAFR90_04420 [Pseudomonadota bacterium]
MMMIWLPDQFLNATCFAQHAGAASHETRSGSPILSRINGSIDAVTGDLIWIGIHKIKLDDITTLKPSHICGLNGRDQRCAIKMRDALAGFARRDDFRCELMLTHAGRPKFSRGGHYAALCFAGDLEINQELVALGWALAASRRYKAAEADARANKRGIHQYDFEDPRTPSNPTTWSTLQKLIQRYPLIFAGGPAVTCVMLLLLLLIIRWRARQHIARLKYDLGKAQSALEATITPLPPHPEPIRRLGKR